MHRVIADVVQEALSDLLAITGSQRQSGRAARLLTIWGSGHRPILAQVNHLNVTPLFLLVSCLTAAFHASVESTRIYVRWAEQGEGEASHD